MNNVETKRRGPWRLVLARTATLGALVAAVLVGPLRSPRVDAQAPQASPLAPAFEVASIKLNTSGDGRVMMQNQPGRFVATNITLRMLIRNAYQLQDFQISGGPSWLTSDHFDINAKIEASTDAEMAAAGPPVHLSPGMR